VSIFRSPLKDLNRSDLQELLTAQAIENLRLEFKREAPKKDEMLKKLSSFANTLGGSVVVGAEAGNDGRITSLPGVDPLPSYKQTIVQWCFEGVAPPLDVEVSEPIPIDGGKVCYVIRVGESELGPHFINGRRGVYVRTNEFSARFEAQLATELELRQLLQRRQTIRDRRAALLVRARSRFNTFVHQKYSELRRGKRDAIGARFDLCIVPKFPANELCSHSRLHQLLTSIHLPWRQVGFPRSTGGGFISQHESIICLRPGSSFSLLEANTWGLMFYATEIELTEPEPNSVVGIHVYHFTAHILVFLAHAAKVLGALGYTGPLSIEMRLEAIRGVPWLFSRGVGILTGPHSVLDDDATFSIDRNADDLFARSDGIAIDLTRFAFFATNWTEMANDRASLEKFVEEGYGYNFWPVPSALRI
jgi:hypothetical protein